jgi:hypothetical protein
MNALAKNTRATQAAKLQAGKAAWAAGIEAKATAQQAAGDETEDADAAVIALRAQLRGLANLAQVALSRLKRDYKNAGLSETQLHEVIPAYEPTPRARLAQPPQPPTPPTGPTVPS